MGIYEGYFQFLKIWNEIPVVTGAKFLATLVLPKLNLHYFSTDPDYEVILGYLLLLLMRN